jgi:hypothetical protein
VRTLKKLRAVERPTHQTRRLPTTASPLLPLSGPAKEGLQTSVKRPTALRNTSVVGYTTSPDLLHACVTNRRNRAGCLHRSMHPIISNPSSGTSTVKQSLNDRCNIHTDQDIPIASTNIRHCQLPLLALPHQSRCRPPLLLEPSWLP